MVNDIILNARTYYKQCLDTKQKNEIVDYLKSRKLSDNTIKLFGLGLSPNNRGLVRYLSEKRYTISDMQMFGLCKTNERSNELYDIMRNRLTMEIRNCRGEVVAFAGRMTHDGRCKYLNTPSTPIFTKGHTVFNLDKAKYAIDYLNDNYLILVEGYFDVMSLWDKGIRNVVAGMGTAFTDKQAMLLRMFTDRVVVCLDGDEAGQMGGDRAVQTLNACGIKSYKLVLPDNLDADEFINKYGKYEFLSLVTTALGQPTDNIR